VTSRTRVLVVDDEKLIRVWLATHLAEAGYEVSTAGTLEEARTALLENPVDALVLDLRLPDGHGLSFLAEVLDGESDPVVVVLSAHGDIETAVEAVKLGAYHFMEKPCTLEDLLITLDKGLETRVLRRTVSGLRRQAGWQIEGVEIVGRSGAMRTIVDLIERVAASEGTTVLVRGESGVGKEVVAKAIHARSVRRDYPFLEINCTALPETLLESELFGYEKGAFTDARERKKGILEYADKGTILLDEIGDLPAGAQAKLLRFLETRSFKRVGGVRDISVDVRIVASTNRDLEAAIAERAFRSDLFYRLNVVPIEIPPLRQRREDVEPLVHHFLDQFTVSLRRPARQLAQETMRRLEAYDWPGNIRELKNIIERTVILHDAETVEPRHLPPSIRDGGIDSSDSRCGYVLPEKGIDLEELEVDLLRQALRRANGSKTAAARLLGLSRDTFRYRIDKHNIDPDQT